MVEHPSSQFSVECIQTTRARELAVWDASLESMPRNCADLEFCHGSLRAHADTMHRLGLIDALELRERYELADAAYSAIVEAQISRELDGGNDYLI